MNRHQTKDSDAIEASLRRDGYAIIENALTTDTLARVNSDLRPYFESAHDGHDNFMGHKTQRFGALFEKSRAVQELALSPAVLTAADAILLDYSANYHIHYTGVMRLMPGEKAQVLHRDTGIFPVANPSPPLTMATMWALDDFTREKGGTILVPGSHLWQDERCPKKSELVYTEMPAGSVLIYTGNVIHGGGDNQAQEPRTGLAIHYGLGWLRQEENQFLACSHEIARSLPEPLQALLGYQLAAPSFGFADHVHPRDYLNGIRDPAKSYVSSQDLFDRHAGLPRLQMTATPPERSRYYEAE